MCNATYRDVTLGNPRLGEKRKIEGIYVFAEADTSATNESSIVQ